MKKLRDEEINYIIQSYNGGMPINKISKKVHVSYKKVKDVLISNGVELRYSNEKLRLSEDVEKQIVKEYLNGVARHQIRKEFNISDSKVVSVLSKYDINKLRTIQQSNIAKFKLNENYFDKQNSHMAYVLGMLASDGTISKTNMIGIELQQSDYKILQNIQHDMGLEREIKFYETSRGYKNCKLYFYSRYIKDKLAEYGIVNNKTYSDKFVFPNLQDEFIPHYIRGYFDGNGCVKKTGNSLTFQIDCPSKDVIDKIKDFFTSKNINCNVCSAKKTNIDLYRLYAYGDNARKIFDIIYKDKDNLFLDRKYEKYLLLK